MSEAPFMDRLVAGEIADLDEVDAEIARWHEHPDPRVELHTWLGLSFDEYALFAVRPEALPLIAQARRKGLNLSDYLRDAKPRRAIDVTALRSWLDETGTG